MFLNSLLLSDREIPLTLNVDVHKTLVLGILLCPRGVHAAYGACSFPLAGWIAVA